MARGARQLAQPVRPVPQPRARSPSTRGRHGKLRVDEDRARAPLLPGRHEAEPADRQRLAQPALPPHARRLGRDEHEPVGALQHGRQRREGHAREDAVEHVHMRVIEPLVVRRVRVHQLHARQRVRRPLVLGQLGREAVERLLGDQVAGGHALDADAPAAVSPELGVEDHLAVPGADVDEGRVCAQVPHRAPAAHARDHFVEVLERAQEPLHRRHCRLAVVLRSARGEWLGTLCARLRGEALGGWLAARRVPACRLGHCLALAAGDNVVRAETPVKVRQAVDDAVHALERRRLVQRRQLE
eukprot:CAMPEP_0119417170 /NCGR_PEP_ID=MMETSP1335-20130426/15075_1 /TAXON_ID=259385 /ORGANISM="Chrysoculter rhomboideus, Strain RCC1486" /LENGTH=299 /DNA_ID=CAMNT_0007442331 /DNA_START=283 /DNA_END=1180 /DNA_ORIENTATION=-